MHPVHGQKNYTPKTHSGGMWSGPRDMDPVVLWALLTVLCSSLLISAIRQVKMYMNKHGPLPETCEPDGSSSACELERHVQQHHGRTKKKRTSQSPSHHLNQGLSGLSGVSAGLFPKYIRSVWFHPKTKNRFLDD